VASNGTASLIQITVFCALASFFDVRYGRIPNKLNGAGLISGATVGYACGGPRGLAASIAGALIGIAILFLPFTLRMVGAGDVKFLSAAGAVVGWRMLWPAFLAGAAFGGAIGLLLIALHDRTLSRFCAHLLLIHAGCWRPLDTDSSHAAHMSHGLADIHMPYAVPLSIGLVAAASIHLVR
jgi:prepilin peptidase CpaA